MSKLSAFLKRHRELLRYLFFGFLTTIVNYLVYLPLLNCVGLSGTLSNVIAWVAAVAFAFVTNKLFVFQGCDWSGMILFQELFRFVGCRLGSGIIETGIILIFVDGFALDGNVIKLITSVLVVILNYIGSKLLVFRK